MRYVVIMAGGSGTRLWPLSRQGRPKQLLEMLDGKSLLRLAYERLIGLVDEDRILVCTGRAHADDVRAQLPELAEGNILGEPEGRDSLNAVAWSAAVVADRDPEGVVAMVTADHIIEPVDEFQRSLATAFEVAEARPNSLVTLGVVPTSPHTGYGYLHRADELDGFPGVHRISEFKEKPALDVAQAYLDSGEYWWNAGMFVWRATTLLGQLDQLLPETARTVREIVADPQRLDELFPTLQKISVDYAVMEPASVGRTDARWSASASTSTGRTSAASSRSRRCSPMTSTATPSTAARSRSTPRAACWSMPPAPITSSPPWAWRAASSSPPAARPW